MIGALHFHLPPPRPLRNMQILGERSRAPTGEKVHKSNRILHALLKKSCKTGGCLLKISDPSTRPIHFPVLAPYNIFEDI